MKLKKLCAFAAAVCVLSPALAGQEKKKFLTPAEFMKIMNDSQVTYRIESLDKLKPEETQDLLKLLYPLACAQVSNPVLDRKDGYMAVKEAEYKNEAVALLEKAETFYGEKKYDEARKIYEQALQADPDCSLAVADIGDCYQFSGQYEKALAQYDQAIRMNPIDHRFHFFRGSPLLQLGRMEEALACYIHALMLRPRYSYALQVLEARRDILKIKIREPFFHPPLLVRQEGRDIAVYIDAEKAGPAWMAYAMAKAVWLGEPSHRREMTGKEDPGWSSTEERECLANLASVYLNLRRNNETPADPGLEVLSDIFLNGDLDAFILYEIYSRFCPYGLLMAPEETQKDVERFIRKYLVVSLE